MEIICPHCQARIRWSEEYWGKWLKCPKCKQTFIIQKLSEEKDNKSFGHNNQGPTIDDAPELVHIILTDSSEYKKDQACLALSSIGIQAAPEVFRALKRGRFVTLSEMTVEMYLRMTLASMGDPVIPILLNEFKANEHDDRYAGVLLGVFAESTKLSKELRSKLSSGAVYKAVAPLAKHPALWVRCRVVRAFFMHYEDILEDHSEDFLRVLTQLSSDKEVGAEAKRILSLIEEHKDKDRVAKALAEFNPEEVKFSISVEELDGMTDRMVKCLSKMPITQRGPFTRLWRHTITETRGRLATAKWLISFIHAEEKQIWKHVRGIKRLRVSSSFSYGLNALSVVLWRVFSDDGQQVDGIPHAVVRLGEDDYIVGHLPLTN